MGKMPSIEVDGQFLSESIAIFSYLEKLSPGLLPSDPFAAAKAMELACHLKLDVELVARRCLPRHCLISPLVMRQRVRSSGTCKGIKAVERLMVCDPYARGSELTIADFYAHYCLGPAAGMARVAGVDLLSDSPMLVELWGVRQRTQALSALRRKRQRSRAYVRPARVVFS